MHRLTRKRFSSHVEIKGSGGLLDLFDNFIKELFIITDDEYDYLAEHMSDEEMLIVLTDDSSFSSKRKKLTIVNSHLDDMYLSKIVDVSNQLTSTEVYIKMKSQQDEDDTD